MNKEREQRETYLNSIQDKSIVNINSVVGNTVLTLDDSLPLSPLPHFENIETDKTISYCHSHFPNILNTSSLTSHEQLTLINENNPVMIPASKINVCDKLRSWVIQYNPSHNSANYILNVMQSVGLNVPKDIRTLMGTPKTHEITNIGNDGSYIHFGIKNMILPVLIKYNDHLHTPNNILKIG